MFFMSKTSFAAKSVMPELEKILKIENHEQICQTSFIVFFT